ncbi:MAG: oligopeptide transporter, OPT family [Candidatus Thermoplasmatota archaeon]
MGSREDFKSFIPAEKTIPELTVKAVLTGVFLAIVLGAANAYLGLYAGMTVSAVIPGTVIALAILRPFKGTILEVNIAKVGASAGECVAAGIIFTIPALVILETMGVSTGWTSIHLIETSLISLFAGIIGVLWMVPLRRALVVKTDLPFPEGIATAAVLTEIVGGKERAKKDKKGSIGGLWLLIGALVAGAYKFAQLSLNLFRGVVEHVVSIGKYLIAGEARKGVLYGGITTSPALLGVGWIVGPKIASYILVGGLIGWVIILPLIALGIGLPSGSALEGIYSIWANQVRYIGVGAMLVGGLWAIWQIKSNLVDSIKEAVVGFKSGAEKTKKRTDKDLSYKFVFICIVLMIIPIFILYLWLSDLFAISLLMAALTVAFAFVASALAGYLTGLVGSSNMPISGVTVAVLLVVSLLMLGFGVTGAAGIAIVIFISAAICVGGSISGDLLQSMASGYMIGATPKKLQISMIFGVIGISIFVGLIIAVLHEAFEIGSKQLPAPQAFLMAGIVKGVMGGEMLWPYVISGMFLAIVLILIDLPVLPVAIGIYLPFTLSPPIFAGGAVRYFTDKYLEKKYGSAKEEEISDWELAIKKTDVKPNERAIRTGLLFTAGLVAGEALTGVVIATLIVLGLGNLGVFGVAPWWPGLLVWIFIAVLLGYIPIRHILNKEE